MSSGFSPSLTLAGMDYIAPSMECVMPTQMRAAGGVTTAAGAAAPPPMVGRHSNGSGGPDGSGAGGIGGRQEVMKITLADCLACSGCVTTAETILVEAQSRRELCSCLGLPVPDTDASAPAGEARHSPTPKRERGEMAARQQQQRRPVLVTISEQSAASLAVHCGLSLVDAMYMISGFLRQALQAEGQERQIYVSDLRWALDIASDLTCKEYLRRVALARHSAAGDGEKKLLPMLVSACPGWVCYCEKQGAALLPLLCPVLSPQGVAGSVAKRAISSELYHISIQPCFDRKLEAARDGYFPSAEGTDAAMTPYTDCVLSTAELLEWMTEVDPLLPWRASLESDLAAFPVSHVDAAAGGGKGEREGLRMEGSGGYHRRAMEAVAAAAPALVDITYEAKRNRNHQIASSPAIPTEAEGGDKHCFCVAYGFQQIQNIVRGVKKNLPAARQYTFVELMACPDGCLNGGGQVRVASGDLQKHAKQLELTERAFTSYLLDHDAPAEGLPQEEKEVGTKKKAFSRAAVEEMVAALEPGALHCTFRDRQREFEEMLNQGNIHSLKW